MTKFENYLLHVDKKQKMMIYAIVVIVLVFVINSISTPLQEELQSIQSNIATVEKSIAKNSINSFKKEIALKSKELLALKTEVEKQKETITALLAKLYTIKFAFFNEKEFANSLEEILKKSINEHLVIHHIKSVELPKEEAAKLLKHKKRIEISGNGDYKAIVPFIHHIEELDAIVRFSSIKMETSLDKVKFLLVLDIYGVGL